VYYGEFVTLWLLLIEYVMSRRLILVSKDNLLTFSLMIMIIIIVVASVVINGTCLRTGVSVLPFYFTVLLIYFIIFIVLLEQVTVMMTTTMKKKNKKTNTATAKNLRPNNY